MMYSDFSSNYSSRVSVTSSTGAVTAGTWTSADSLAWRGIRSQLRKLGLLDIGWDGDEAEAPGSLLIDSAMILLDELEQQTELPAPTRVVPTLDGGVVIEWRLSGRYVEIEIEEPYCGDVMDVRDGIPARHYSWCWEGLKPEIRSDLAPWPEAISYVPPYDRAQEYSYR